MKCPHCNKPIQLNRSTIDDIAHDNFFEGEMSFAIEMYSNCCNGKVKADFTFSPILTYVSKLEKGETYEC